MPPSRSVRTICIEAARRVGLAVGLLLSWCGTGLAGADGEPLKRSRPLAFEANRGQADVQVKYVARGAGYAVFLTATEAVVTLGHRQADGGVLRLRPLAANPAAQVVAEAALPGVVNYSRGAGGAAPISAPTYARVRYVDLYPGIDLVYYGRPRDLEYDFVVGAGADPGQIALVFEGARRIAVDAGGDLLAHTAAGVLRQPRPVAYQEVDGDRRPVTADYVVAADGSVRFRVGPHDVSRPLVIDPVLAYSTYLGGSGDEADGLYGAVLGVAVDTAGNAYVTGTTRSTDFPTTAGGDTTMGGDQDVFVTKLSPTGAVLYSTYLGGPCDDVARSIAIDAAGNAYLTGRAHSGTCTADVQPGVLVAKLDPAGAVAYWLVFGGELADTSIGQAIAVDTDGHAYVSGVAQSPTRDFPTTPGAYRTTDCGTLPDASGGDGFVAKVNAAGTGLVYSTYLCGNAHDSPNGIAVDAAGNAYVAGSTDSHDFPTVNPLQPTHRGGPVATTGFIAKLSADGGHLVYSTYLGGGIDDIVHGIAVDAQGNAYVTGATESDDFPTTPGVLQPAAGNYACGWDFCQHAFVTKLNAAGTGLAYSTFVFGESHDIGTRIAVDAAGNAYVVGRTASIYFPIADAFQSENRGLDDAFVIKLSPDGARVVYSSYLGGSRGTTTTLEGVDSGSAIAVDAAGNAYVAGYTASRDFPTTPGAFQPGLGGGVCDYSGTPCGDAFVAKITAGGAGVVPPISASVTPWELAPGGTLTATWAGLPAPSLDDRLQLYPLGWPGDEFAAVPSWPTNGAAAGTIVVTIPDLLAPGTYELRVLSQDPEFGNLLEFMARSRPIRIGPPASDLAIASIVTTPAQPAVGQAVAITVTVTNQGAAPAGGFVVDFYKDRAAAPVPGIAGDVRCAVAALTPGASAQCTGTVSYGAAGTASAWAQVDSGQAVTESNEANNVAGPRTITVGGAQADLIVSAVGNPPASGAPGGTFTASDTVRNQGAAGAGQSKTRYYLSLDAVKDPADRLLTGVRSVAALAAGTQSVGTVTVTISATTPAATYRLLACADDTELVTEASETNNCLTAQTAIVVGRPDLVETAVTNPPVAARPGSSFAVTDIVSNQGNVAAGASTTRYYLSADATRSLDDRLLTGSRSVATLAPGATSTSTATVTIPATMARATYVLLACADDTKMVTESAEDNNCRASATTITVALPDVVEQSVSNPGGPFRPGAAFTVSDTALNAGQVSTGASSKTRYYLSADTVRNTGDIRLTGARTVPILGPSATSSGAVSVVIPSGTVARTYFLLACADDTRLIAESAEANNCRASATAIQVSP